MTWTITEHTESPFEKSGRLYIKGENLVIRSDLDHRGFCISRADLPAVLDGEEHRSACWRPAKRPGPSVSRPPGER